LIYGALQLIRHPLALSPLNFHSIVVVLQQNPPIRQESQTDQANIHLRDIAP
jgi:hypothetical protein